MTKKDFELIANIIRTRFHGSMRSNVARQFALALKETNPRFNELMFRTACQPANEDIAGNPLPAPVTRNGEF